MKKAHARLRRRPFYFPLFLPVVGFLMAALVISWFLNSQSTTTIILVRHAEKLIDNGDDPALSQEGKLRAYTLAHVAGKTGVAAIYASQFKRTQATARPLAEQLGLEVQTVDAGDADLLYSDVMARHRGEVVLIVGHSNTIPELVQLFGDDEIPEISEDEYANLYVVTIPWFGKRRILRLAFGEPG